MNSTISVPVQNSLVQVWRALDPNDGVLIWHRWYCGSAISRAWTGCHWDIWKRTNSLVKRLLATKVLSEVQYVQGLSSAQLLASVELFIFIKFYIFLLHHNDPLFCCQPDDILWYRSSTATLLVTLSPLSWTISRSAAKLWTNF